MMASMAAAVVVVSTVAACGHGAAQAPLANKTDGAHSAASEVRGIDWQNRTYVLDELGPVAVKNGEALVGLVVDGTPQTRDGSYSVARPVFTDVNGDGVEDAIILNMMSTGGTGRFSDVRIYTMRAGKVAELAMIPGGDRGDGGIRRVAVDGPAVIVERNVLAEGDGACCASQARRERWVWRSGEIVEDEAARRVIPANP
jgi:hypothetical protein